MDDQVTRVSQTGKLPSPVYVMLLPETTGNFIMLLLELSLTFLKVPLAEQKYSKVQIIFSAFDNISSDDRSLQAISIDSPPSHHQQQKKYTGNTLCYVIPDDEAEIGQNSLTAQIHFAKYAHTNNLNSNRGN